MKLTIEQTLSVIGGEVHNVTVKYLQEIVDWFSVVETRSISKPNTAKIIVYFAVYDTDPLVCGWYDKPFDKRQNLEKAFRANPEWLFVTDQTQDDIQHLISIGCKLCVVNDTLSAATTLHRKILNNTKPIVIGVTGSVGKTTCVALLEDVMSVYGKTVRIYSKRLSPMSVMTACMNYLEVDCEYVVMEYSLYRFWHIEDLLYTLPVDISVMLDITGAHIGVGGMISDYDIFRGKRALLEQSMFRVVSSDASLYRKNNWHNNTIIFGLDDSSLEVSFNTKKKRFSLWDEEYTLDLPIFTELSVKQVLVAFATISCLGFQLTNDVLTAIINFTPKENRLTLFTYKGVKIIFDGETTYMSRIVALAGHYYNDAALVIVQQNHGNEPLEPQRQILLDHHITERFSRVYVISSIERDWLEIFGSVLEPKIFHSKDLVDVITSHKVVFIHAGGWWRYEKKVDLSFIF